MATSAATSASYDSEAEKGYTYAGEFKAGHPEGLGSVFFGGQRAAFRGRIFREPVRATSIRFKNGVFEEIGAEERDNLHAVLESAHQAKEKSRDIEDEAKKASAEAVMLCEQFEGTMTVLRLCL